METPGLHKRELTIRQGPAHAVYFGTYEVVKEMAGGNKADGKHHPLAAGTTVPRSAVEHLIDICSYEWSGRYDIQRCLNEPL